MTVKSTKEALIEILKAEGVEYIFGLPGSTEIMFMEALQDHPEINYMLGMHESVSLGMAEGYARATGKVGFVNVHTSSGLAAAMPLLLNASDGGVPLVITAGLRDTTLLMQEPSLGQHDLIEMMDQFTKWSTVVRYPQDLGMAMRRAFKVAAHPPSGPVFVALPQDIMKQDVDLYYRPNPPALFNIRPDQVSVNKAVDILSMAKNPVIFIGTGVAANNALKEVVDLAEMIGAPVFQDDMADVNFPVRHPQYLGIPDESSQFFKELTDSSDAVIIIGVTQFYVPEAFLANDKQIIQIDNDTWEIGKNFAISVGVEGNIGLSIREIIANIEKEKSEDSLIIATKNIERVAQEAKRLRDIYHAKAEAEKDEVPIAPTRLMKELNNILEPDTVIVDDAWTSSDALIKSVDLKDSNQYFRFRGGGSIGWAMPGALGVKLGFPDRPVVSVTGDGSAMWANQSWWTAAKYNLNVTYVVCANNSYQFVKMGKIRQLGDKSKGRFLGMEFDEPRIDFVQMAQSMGLKGKKVENPNELADVLKWGLDHEGPSVVEVAIAKKPF